MTPPRLLLLNPNTTAAMTASMAARMEAQLAGRATVRSVTAAFGHPVIASRVSYAVAAHAAIEAYAQAGEGADAVVLGCFGDPGLEALREVAPVPVVGLAEAAFLAAIAFREPFAVLTIGPAWQAMLAERVRLLPGGAALCRRVLALPGTGLDYAVLDAERIAALDAAVDTLAAAGAATVVLGGGVLAGAAPRLRPRARLLDGLHEATELALRQAA